MHALRAGWQEWEAWVEPFRMKLKQIWSHRDGATILRTD